MTTALTFTVCLLGFTIIGLLSARHREATSEDYLVAGRKVSPWLTALSSAATNNSGFMFIGLIGFAYRFGVQAVWLQLGWIVGDWVAWRWVHGRVRLVSGALGACSTPALIATNGDHRVVKALSISTGALTLLFLGGYAAAQLKAGSTALQVLFDWPASGGAILGAMIVLLYCFSGGLRASIWTDAAQAIVMIAGMGIMLAASWSEVGHPGTLAQRLSQTDPALMDWMPTDLRLGFGWYLVGFVFGGLGVVGQPHILARSMAIESASAIPRARRIYFLWYVPFSCLAVLVGLYSRVLLPELASGEHPATGSVVQTAELAFPRMAETLLPDALVGLVLAGLFSATMSTADSQVLSCSAAITQDIAPRWRNSYTASKAATTVITVLALSLALSATDGVFDLVLRAWSALGATLGPLVLLRVFGRPVSTPLALGMMSAGLGTVLFWEASPWNESVFKLLPGMVAPFMLYAIAQAATQLHSRFRARRL